MAEVAGEHGLCSYTVELHIWDPLGLYIWNPALWRILTDSSSEGLAPDAPPRLAAEGTEELDRVYSTDSLEQF